MGKGVSLWIAMRCPCILFALIHHWVIYPFLFTADYFKEKGKWPVTSTSIVYYKTPNVPCSGLPVVRPSDLWYDAFRDLYKSNNYEYFEQFVPFSYIPNRNAPLHRQCPWVGRINPNTKYQRWIGLAECKIGSMLHYNGSKTFLAKRALSAKYQNTHNLYQLRFLMSQMRWLDQWHKWA